MGYQRQSGPCDVVACERKATTKGMCNAHAARRRAAGDSREVALLYPPVKARAAYGSNDGNPCSTPGCELVSKKRGMCDSHYAAWFYSRGGSESGEFVYLLDAPGWTPEGVAKIGHGTEARLKDFRTTLPTARFVRQVFVEKPGRIEVLAHYVLADRRVSGEWFRVTPEEFDATIERCLRDAGLLDPARADVSRQARALGL